MSYCAGATQATVLVYSANQLVEQVQFDFGDIDIAAGNFTDIFYGGNWIPIGGNTTYSDLKVPGTITEIGPRINVGGNSQTTLSNGWTPNFYGNNAVNVSFRYFCSISVSKGGKILFEKEFPCPLSFEVACGGDCPPGYCKCRTLKYPGFCCCKCSKHGG